MSFVGDTGWLWYKSAVRISGGCYKSPQLQRHALLLVNDVECRGGASPGPALDILAAGTVWVPQACMLSWWDRQEKQNTELSPAPWQHRHQGAERGEEI